MTNLSICILLVYIFSDQVFNLPLKLSKWRQRCIGKQEQSRVMIIKSQDTLGQGPPPLFTLKIKCVTLS